VGVVLRVLRGGWWKLAGGNGILHKLPQAAAFIDAQQFAKGAKGYNESVLCFFFFFSEWRLQLIVV
jgi:hypothetical protein